MASEEMEALGERIGQAWNEGRPDLLDEVYRPGFINRSNGQDCEATKKVLIQSREALPDLRLSADDIIVAGDKIVIRGVARAVHTGPYLGIPATASALNDRTSTSSGWRKARSSRNGRWATTSASYGSWAC